MTEEEKLQEEKRIDEEIHKAIEIHEKKIGQLTILTFN